jgi:hypothetical protein
MKSHPVASDFSLSACRRAPWRGWCFRLAALVLLPLAVSAQTATSAVPSLFNFQGKVANANGTLIGAGTPVNRLVIFRVWDHPSATAAGNLIYSEQQTVTITDGEFSVLLGSGSAVSGESTKGPPTITIGSPAVFGGATRYLGITIDDGTTAADPEISPRQQLVTSAYAFRAKYAESVGANGGNALVTLDNGNVGIGTTSPATRLEVSGNIRAGGASVANPQFQLLANHATNVASSIGFAASAGQLSTDAAASDTVLRTDNGGKLLLQTGTGASAIAIDANNRVGIGTTSPATKLDVNGAIGLNSGIGNNAARPVIGTTRIGGEIAGYSGSGGATQDDGFLRLSAGGGTTASAKSFIDLSGFSNVANMDKTLVFGTAGTERMRIDASGRVGIGLTNPISTLTIGNGIIDQAGSKATLTLSGSTTAPESSARPGIYHRSNIGLGLFSDFQISFQTNGATSLADAMRIDGNGNVGIGTNAPGARLEVSSPDTVNTAYIYNSGGGGGTQPALRVKTNAGTGARNVIQAENFNGTVFMVRDDGRVGFGGITNPTQATVAIGGSGVSQTGLVGAFINSGLASNAVTHGTHPVSLYTSGSIWSGHTVIATSDARTKLVQGRSDASADLQTLLGIEITDFQYKDRVAKGGSPQKKVVAQQVEKVFPQAVGQQTETVPDIYSAATYRDGWVRLANALNPGERVRLIGDNAEGVYEVLEAKPDSFRTAFVPSTDNVFVYGREVKDFRTVDYDAIAMLNVSATQELARQNDALRTANAALAARVADLEAKDRARDTKLAAIEKLLQSDRTVMAAPAKTTAGNGQE